MMRKTVGILLMTVIALTMMTSSSMPPSKKGIQFSDVSFEKAKKVAAKSGKLIFIDCYTDWCGPCKKMAKTAFRDYEIGEVYNESFVCLKVEMEKEEDGKVLARKYRVAAYPTLLIIDARGNLVRTTVGYKTKDQLMALAESVL